MTERQKELSAKAPKGKEVDLPLARHSRPSPVKTMVLSRSGSRSSNSTLDMSKIADSARKSEEISCRTKSMANEVVVPSKRVGQRLVGTRFFPFLPRLCPSSPCCYLVCTLFSLFPSPLPHPPSVQFSSAESLDQSGRRGDMRDDQQRSSFSLFCRRPL